MTWQSQAIALLAASLVRPLLLAAAAWLILRIFRVRHPASHHAVWSAVLAGMLLLPVASVMAPHWKLPLLPRRGLATDGSAARTPLKTDDTAASGSSGFAAGGVSSLSPAPASPRPSAFEWPAPGTMWLWCYLTGVLAMAGYRVTGWIMLARVMSRSKTPRLRRLRESSDVLVPVTVGVLRPAVLLPEGWRTWPADTKRAVLAHEFAHIRRGDMWISLLTRLARCVYWFHPLAWWISRQIACLAELSCDAVVLEKTGDPAGYSRILLGFAETVHSAGYRATLPGLAIASRSGVGQRIDQVFELASGNLRGLSRPGIVLTLVGLPVIGIAATVGLTAQAPGGAWHPAAAATTPPQPALVAELQQTPGTQPKPARPPAAPRPKFDVVSVRPCTPGHDLTRRSGEEEGGGGGRGPHYSPGMLRMQCMTVGAMMQMAYLGMFGDGDGLLNYIPSLADDKWLRKAPGWVNSDLYTVQAKTDDPAAKVPNRPGQRNADKVLERMLQVALEERFQLKLHRETEDVPMYNLTVAKGGLRLKPMAAEGCIEPDPSKGLPSPNGVFITGEWSPAGKTPPCMIVLHTKGPDWVLDAGGQRPGNLIGMLSKALNRHVFDKTGIADRYTFHLQFAHDDSTPGNLPPAMTETMFPPNDVPSGPSIFTVLERLGLKLEPARGPQEHFVIDRIERPSAN